MLLSVLKAGDISRTNNLGENAFHLAIRAGHLEILELLLENVTDFENALLQKEAWNFTPSSLSLHGYLQGSAGVARSYSNPKSENDSENNKNSNNEDIYEPYESYEYGEYAEYKIKNKK